MPWPSRRRARRCRRTPAVIVIVARNAGALGHQRDALDHQRCALDNQRDALDHQRDALRGRTPDRAPAGERTPPLSPVNSPSKARTSGMEILIWCGLIGGTLLLIWYGYGLLVRRPDGETGEAGGEVARCHLCRREFPIRSMVTREKVAGFENHFCGDCIEDLYRDWTEHPAHRSPASSLPGRN
jgi:hypothetical protein